jgi:hypothetical protein
MRIVDFTRNLEGIFKANTEYVSIQHSWNAINYSKNSPNEKNTIMRGN